MPTARYIGTPGMVDSATGLPHDEVTMQCGGVRFRQAGLGRVKAVRHNQARASDAYEYRVRRAVLAGALRVDGTAIEIDDDDMRTLDAFRLHRGLNGQPDYEVTP